MYKLTFACSSPPPAPPMPTITGEVQVRLIGNLADIRAQAKKLGLRIKGVYPSNKGGHDHLLYGVI